MKYVKFTFNGEKKETEFISSVTVAISTDDAIDAIERASKSLKTLPVMGKVKTVNVSDYGD